MTSPQSSLPSKRRVFLALGSNLGDRWSYLRGAVASLPDVVVVSPAYETDPVGGPAGQGAYLNAVVELRTAIPARSLLAIAQQIEQDADRVRAEKDGPRTLDVDILIIEGETHDDPDLQVPHPRMWQRRFVLQPLSDLAPELVPDDWESQAVGQVRLVGSL